MKNPILAGVLNVIVPGAGMAYLGKWKDGLVLFFIALILVLFGKSVIGYLGYPYLEEVEATSVFASALIFTIQILQGVKIVCMVWILFNMAYHEANGMTLRKNPAIAVALNFISAGLGFVYLQKWLLSIGAFLWITFFLGLISSAYMTVGEKDMLPFWVKLLVSLLLGAYLYWDTSVTAYREAKKINKGHETKAEGIEPQALTPQSS